MLSTIRQMSRDQRERLLGIVEGSAVDPKEFDDDELYEELIRGIREALQVPKDADLPEYFRRRLVEVGHKDFGIERSFDDLTDVELAQTLLEHALSAVSDLDADKTRRDEFAKFLRTKDAGERYSWLLDSERVAALASDGTFDRADASRRAREIAREPKAYKTTASRIASSLTSAAGGNLGGAAAGTALAGPVSAVSGALLMSGMAWRGADDTAQIEGAVATATAKERQRRARRSRLVQRVMAICAFFATNPGEAPSEVPGSPKTR